jgi:hypothetical protein
MPYFMLASFFKVRGGNPSAQLQGECLVPRRADEEKDRLYCEERLIFSLLVERGWSGVRWDACQTRFDLGALHVKRTLPDNRTTAFTPVDGVGRACIKNAPLAICP